MNKKALDDREDLQSYLFDKGFLITDRDDLNLSVFPFYNNWKKISLGRYHTYIHNRTKIFHYEFNDCIFFLIGHAYNPFRMDVDENEILKKIAEDSGKESRSEILDELTGVFLFGKIIEDKLILELDCSGMQYGCYGFVNEHLYVASHMRFIGDICHLETDDYVKRLVNYRWYHFMMGNYLPGDLTCFYNVKRIIPNTFVTFQNGQFEITRFYPNRELKMCQNSEEYTQVIREASQILKNTMALIPKKWSKPAISLTGGIDSNTTFAATNGLYDQYETFSYVSMYRESVDAEAAKTISEHFKVPYNCYCIPENNEEVQDFDLFKQIFIHNDGDIGGAKDNDVRKKITLINSDVCDVEVKSWISETIRAYAYKYFRRKRMPKDLKPRHYTSLYKIFLLNRKLVFETDKYFKDYLEKTKFKEHLFNYDESDFFVWEMMHGGKCGLNIGVMKSCFDITIPYNNRKLLDMLLRVPFEKRLSDELHLDLKANMNKELYDMNIRVVNLNETARRKQMANFYFNIHSRIPF